MCVKTCEHYIYLGSPFSLDGLSSSSIRINASLRMCQALKFVSFCHKNNDIPFYVKNKFFHAALMSSNIYGCESWLQHERKYMIHDPFSFAIHLVKNSNISDLPWSL